MESTVNNVFTREIDFDPHEPAINYDALQQYKQGLVDTSGSRLKESFKDTEEKFRCFDDLGIETGFNYNEDMEIEEMKINLENYKKSKKAVEEIDKDIIEKKGLFEQKLEEALNNLESIQKSAKIAHHDDIEKILKEESSKSAKELRALEKEIADLSKSYSEIFKLQKKREALLQVENRYEIGILKDRKKFKANIESTEREIKTLEEKLVLIESGEKGLELHKQIKDLEARKEDIQVFFRGRGITDAYRQARDACSIVGEFNVDVDDVNKELDYHVLNEMLNYVIKEIGKSLTTDFNNIKRRFDNFHDFKIETEFNEKVNMQIRSQKVNDENCLEIERKYHTISKEFQEKQDRFKIELSEEEQKLEQIKKVANFPKKNSNIEAILKAKTDDPGYKEALKTLKGVKTKIGELAKDYSKVFELQRDFSGLLKALQSYQVDLLERRQAYKEEIKREERKLELLKSIKENPEVTHKSIVSNEGRIADIKTIIAEREEMLRKAGDQEEMHLG